MKHHRAKEWLQLAVYESYCPSYETQGQYHYHLLKSEWDGEESIKYISFLLSVERTESTCMWGYSRNHISRSTIVTRLFPWGKQWIWILATWEVNKGIQFLWKIRSFLSVFVCVFLCLCKSILSWHVQQD